MLYMYNAGTCGEYIKWCSVVEAFKDKTISYLTYNNNKIKIIIIIVHYSHNINLVHTIPNGTFLNNVFFTSI